MARRDAFLSLLQASRQRSKFPELPFSANDSLRSRRKVADFKADEQRAKLCFLSLQVRFRSFVLALVAALTMSPLLSAKEKKKKKPQHAHKSLPSEEMKRKK